MLQTRKLTRILEPCVRNYKKRPILEDGSRVDKLPAYHYPSKSHSETLLYAWGLSEHGALGHYIQKKKKMRSRTDPRFKKFSRPFRHLFGEQHKVTNIAAGFGFSAVSVSSNDCSKVYGMGLNTDSQIGFHEARKDHPLGVILSPVPISLPLKYPKMTKVIGISAGRAHLVIATDLEGVFTLGNNSYGQCGRVVIKNEEYLGSRVLHNVSLPFREMVKSVECGQDHTLLLTESGKVYAFGWGADGQTGLGHYLVEACPTRVLGDIEGENIVKISSKSDCILAINDKGDVFGWGNSEYGQLFNKGDIQQQVNRPVFIKKCRGFGKIVDVAAGGSHCLMVNEAGDVFSWGFGILGRGPEACYSWKPEMLPVILFGRNDFQPEARVTAVFCGMNHSAAVNNVGEIYTWGKNKSGCLGLGQTSDQFFPLRVYIGGLAEKLALGVDHSLALCKPL